MQFSRTSRTLSNILTKQPTNKRHNHYKTLGIAQDASKAQIKSSFYRLSKQHHPDLNPDPKSQDVFTKLNEAYQILANDRERRAYDRSLLSRGGPQRGQGVHWSPQAPPQRTSRATYAWDHTYTARSSQGTYTFHARSTGGFKNPQPDYDPSATPRRPGYQPYTRPAPSRDHLTGSRKRSEERAQEMDKIRNTNTYGRAAQIFGFLAVAVSLFGGFGIPGVS